jgi:hypothetical protein
MLMATEFPVRPDARPALGFNSKPLLLIIGTTRYAIQSRVEITPLRPRQAEVIPIDRASKEPCSELIGNSPTGQMRTD